MNPWMWMIIQPFVEFWGAILVIGLAFVILFARLVKSALDTKRVGW